MSIPSSRTIQENLSFIEDLNKRKWMTVFSDIKGLKKLKSQLSLIEVNMCGWLSEH